MRSATLSTRLTHVVTAPAGSRVLRAGRVAVSLLLLGATLQVRLPLAEAQNSGFQQRPTANTNPAGFTPTNNFQSNNGYQPNGVNQPGGGNPARGQQTTYPASNQPYPQSYNPTNQPIQPAYNPNTGFNANQPTHVAALPVQAGDPASLPGDAADGEESAESTSSLTTIKQFTASLYNHALTGGWLMLPLLVCGIVVGVLTIERLWALRRGRVIPRPFVRRFTECVEDGQLSFEEAQQICEEFSCPVAEVFQAAVKRWGRPMLEIEQAVIDAGDRVSERLSRFLRVFYAISHLAPLFGLLGTVLGMITAFNALSEGSFSGTELLAAGIGQALITTAAGLMIAIPAYLSYIYFTSVSDRYLNEIDRLCQRLIDTISAEGMETTSRTRRSRRAA